MAEIDKQSPDTQSYPNIFPLFSSFLFSPFFSKLGLHLPHPVDSKNGKAQWDKSKNLLTVTLRMLREYDFLNQ